MSTESRTHSRYLRITRLVLLFAVLGGILHQLGPRILLRGAEWWEPHKWTYQFRLWDWFIEDAAISFSFSRNWAAGDGLVAFRGDERIEGYSNPLFVAIIAFFYLFGIEGFVSAKYLGFFLGSLSILFTYGISKEMLDPEGKERSYYPLIAPVMLACFPNFAFWNTGGLENGLFCTMMAGGIWRTLVEIRKGGYPFSSLFFLGVATTRPEGIMYSAWGGFMYMVYQLRKGRGLKGTILWLLTFFVPFLSYHAIRYNYFAWAFPNTYYAKLGAKEFKPFNWAARGWRQIREFSFTTGTGWFTPVFLSGLLGVSKKRAFSIAGLTLLIAFLFIYPTSAATKELTWWPQNMWSPDAWSEIRVYSLLGLALLLPVFATSTKGAPGRIISWGMAMITLFFYIRSTGDWANGYRWMSFLSVPLAVLFSTGVYEWAEGMRSLTANTNKTGILGRIRSKAGAITTAVLCIAILPGWFMHTDWFLSKRVTGPFSVKKRAEYTASVTDKLWIDGQVYNIDVDMGAHMYWSPHIMIDMAGLVDIPIAQHNYGQRAFVREWVFKQRKPQIAHIHGSWAKTSRIPEYPEFKNNFFQVEPFLAGKKTNHIGTYIRRDFVFTDRWPHGDRKTVPFADGITFEGVELPSPEVSVNKSFYLKVGTSITFEKAKDVKPVRLIGFLSNAEGALHSFEMPLAYDWLNWDEWRSGEIFYGHFSPPLPVTLKAGSYDLGFVYLYDDGTVLRPLAEENIGEAIIPMTKEEARYALGEIRFPNALTIGPAGTGERAASDDFEAALTAANQGRCVRAEVLWRLSRQHIPRAIRQHADYEERLKTPMAECFVRAAEANTDPAETTRLIRKARHWDYRSEVLHDAQDRLAKPWYDAGIAARAEEDWAAAWTNFNRAINLNPSLAWARRYAEEARDQRLKLNDAAPPSPAKPTKRKPLVKPKPRPKKPLSPSQPEQKQPQRTPERR